MQRESSFRENKMGVMPIGKLLFTMSVPMMISMLVQALYNVVDSIFVSRISENALTALSMAFPIQNLMISVAVGVGTGINAILSRALGAKNEKQVNDSASNGFLLMAISGIVFMLLGLVLPNPFFHMQTDIVGIIEAGTTYTSIVLIGSFGIFMQVFFERLLQSTGKTLMTMISQATGAIVNIIMDPILIFGYFGFPAMGVAGAAYATILGQWTGALIGCMLHTHFNTEVQMRLRGFRPNLVIIQLILKIAVPSIVMMSIGSIMNFLMNQILISFTATAVAVFGIYFKLQSFVFMPVFGLNNGGVPIIAYNYGAKRADRMRQTVRYIMIAAVTVMSVGMLIFQIFPEQLLSLFEASPDMLLLGIPALRTISLNFPIAAVGIAMVSVFQALGYSIYSMIISLIRQLIVLIPSAYLLARLTGNLNMTWWAFVIAEGVSLLCCFYFYRRIRRNVIDIL